MTTPSIAPYNSLPMIQDGDPIPPENEPGKGLPPPDCGPEPVILRQPQHRISKRDIDPDALRIIYRLHSHGFIAYLCGGAVRDLMLGRPPKDFDIVTDARPGQIKKRFANVFVIGRRFRLAHIHFREGKIIEVATFRKDAGPEVESAAIPEAGRADTRRFYGTPREDAFRRDITINALLYDAVADSVIDYVGGLEDLKQRKVRTIGDPSERFVEDPVRIWRVLRHAARLGFDIEEATERAIRSHGRLLAQSSGARLYEELIKDLANETRSVFEALGRFNILGYILGRAGEDLEADPAIFSRLCALLEIKDRAVAGGLDLSLEETSSLVFWPWMEGLFAGVQGDMHPILNKAFEAARTGATLPRSLRANVIQILIIVGYMMRALQTGRMRWSLQKRSHYAQASRVFFIIEKGRPPESEESFESLFRVAYPSEPAEQRHRWRPRRRRRGISA